MSSPEQWAQALTQLRRRLAEAHRELIVLRDHDNESNESHEAVWPPNDQLLAPSSIDSTTIWDTSDERAVLRGHDGEVRRVTEITDDLRCQVRARAVVITTMPDVDDEGTATRATLSAHCLFV